MDIRASQVERPSYVVERGGKHSAGVHVLQPCSYALKFRGARLSGILQRMNGYLVLRHRRTVGPYLPERIKVGSYGNAALIPKSGNELCHRSL